MDYSAGHGKFNNYCHDKFNNSTRKGGKFNDYRLSGDVSNSINRSSRKPLGYNQ